jgi:hypothetical protein
MLGDATDDVSCYEKAWEMSGQRSAKAKRHWGFYYYHRKQVTDKNLWFALPHLKKSIYIGNF